MKQKLFFENTRLLNDQFNIVPLLYGSLGLEYITGEDLQADDIDILIPNRFLSERWEEFKSFLTACGYALVDEHEHTFEKDKVLYSYASVEELETFAQITPSEQKTQCRCGASFRVLSATQYLKVYMTSSKDGYRINVRKKKDADKILFLQK